MAGKDENSWKNILIKNGYNVETNIKGLGENKKVREMYVQHLKNLIQS
jgi:sirohydrochlorin cobaltochelatase